MKRKQTKKMGNSQSTSINQTIDIVTQNLVTALSETTAVSSQINVNKQDLKVIAHGATIDCEGGFMLFKNKSVSWI